MAAQIGWSVAAPAESDAPRPMRGACAPHAWLGLHLSKPDETTAAQLPDLPPGIGFVVKSIDEGGPAQVAGIAELDLLWKIGDQMLVNEAQVAALLRLSKPGQEIVLSGFRAGKPMEVRLKLGEAPNTKKPFTCDMVESSIFPGGRSGPMRVVNVAEKSASFSADKERAVVRREGEIYLVKIEGPEDAVIFDGELAKDEALDKLPESWRQRIQVLCRTLDRALEANPSPQRQPRPRVVPAPPQPRSRIAPLAAQEP